MVQRLTAHRLCGEDKPGHSGEYGPKKADPCDPGETVSDNHGDACARFRVPERWLGDESNKPHHAQHRDGGGEVKCAHINQRVVQIIVRLHGR